MRRQDSTGRALPAEFAPFGTTHAPLWSRRGATPQNARLVVFVASLLLLAVTIRVFVGGTYVYAGVAFHVDPGDARQEAALRVAVGMLKTAMDKNVCLSCPHSGTALRCIVWNDGRVWLNPVVTVRSEHTTEGYETPFNAGASERRLVKRAAWLTVMHDGDTEERVVDGEAHCLEACLELFDGKELPPL